MKKFIHSQKGQGLIELLCGVIAGMFILNGLLQLLLLGAAQLRLEWAARRYVWLQSRSNYAGFQIQQAETLAGYPLETSRLSIGSSHTSPAAYRFAIHIPPVGFLRLLVPQGFRLSTRQAVFAYVEPNTIQPGKWMQEGLKRFLDWIAPGEKK